jgi:AraC family transcriptional regulator
MQVTRRTLFDGELLQVMHVRARPSPQEHAEIERQSVNVVVLPLAGVFTMHEGPRKRAIATPSHAALIAAGRPYRTSLLTNAGDECLALRFSASALGRLAPESMSVDGFDLSAFETCTPLAPGALLARGLLWRNFKHGEWDPLEVEEIGAALLVGALRAARKSGRSWERTSRARPARRLRQVGRVLEAVSTHPDRKWTLGALAALAHVSPWHLSRVFREETGASVHQYVIRARLGKALDAVFDSDADLSSIAHEAGFASHSHFTARFRDSFGVTPLDLRRKLRRGTAAQMRRIVTAGTPASL